MHSSLEQPCLSDSTAYGEIGRYLQSPLDKVYPERFLLLGLGGSGVEKSMLAGELGNSRSCIPLVIRQRDVASLSCLGIRNQDYLRQTYAPVIAEPLIQ